jgi:hypothetical protein
MAKHYFNPSGKTTGEKPALDKSAAVIIFSRTCRPSLTTSRDCAQKRHSLLQGPAPRRWWQEADGILRPRRGGVTREVTPSACPRRSFSFRHPSGKKRHFITPLSRLKSSRPQYFSRTTQHSPSNNCYYSE